MVWSINKDPLSHQHIYISSYIKCYSFTALMVDSIMKNPNELAKYNFKIKTISTAITSFPLAEANFSSTTTTSSNITPTATPITNKEII